MPTVTVRNTITNERIEVPAESGRTVKEAVARTGFVRGEFSVRDKAGVVIDDQPITAYPNTVVNVGLPGRTVVGGNQ